MEKGKTVVIRMWENAKKIIDGHGWVYMIHGMTKLLVKCCGPKWW